MRIWGWIPTIGSELPKFSRRYFFTGSVLAMAIISAYTWAQFPFDNLCVSTNSTAANVTGVYTDVVFPLLDDPENKLPKQITVTNPNGFEFCFQSWRDVSGFSFPPTPRIQPDDKQWMARNGDETKESLISMYGWTSLAYLIVFFVVLFGGTTYTFFISFFRGTYVRTKVTHDIRKIPRTHLILISCSC